MKTNIHLDSSISAATRVSVVETQAKLAEAQKEVTTGRLADVGASLGYKTGQTLSLRQDYARLKTIIDTNSVVSTRLSTTQTSLTSLTRRCAAVRRPADRCAQCRYRPGRGAGAGRGRAQHRSPTW